MVDGEVEVEVLRVSTVWMVLGVATLAAETEGIGGREALYPCTSAAVSRKAVSRRRCCARTVS